MPQAGFLGEETREFGLDREHVWVVDPIDGTSNFANGLPHWAVAVALLKDRRPVLAAIWSEPECALYTAVRTRGAHKNGRRLRSPRPRWDDGSIVGCQWDAAATGPSILRELQTRGARVRSYGSTVVQLLDVACGRLDANVQPRGRIWDLAAPALVLEEVGGRLTDWTGRPVFPAAVLGPGHHPSLAALPVVHSILRKKFQRMAPLVSGA